MFQLLKALYSSSDWESGGFKGKRIKFDWKLSSFGQCILKSEIENKGFIANSLWIFVWGEINTFLTRNWVIKRPVMYCGCGIPGLMVMYQRPSLDRIFGWWGRQAHFLIYQGVKWNFIELIWSPVPLIIVRKGE